MIDILYNNNIVEEHVSDTVFNLEFVDFSCSSQRKEYEHFIQNHRNGSFTQCPEWCGVKHNWEHKAIMLRNYEGHIVAAMLILIKKIKVLRTSLLYSPRGPVCDLHNKLVVSELLKGICILAKKYNSYLFKCDPFVTADDNEFIGMMKDLGFKFTPGVPDTYTIQSRCNYMLNIENKSADEVFQSFHSKWRYNIRLAERKGVTCSVYGEEKLYDFYGLMEETANRHNFAMRSKDYFKRMLKSLGSHCRLYMCYYEGKPVSGAIAVQYAGRTCYVYGASTENARGVMPNYLMQWNMIQWAVENNNYIYDFQGIPFYYDENHPNYGVYRFKKGFNGYIIEFAGEFDYVFSPLYKSILDISLKVYTWVMNLLGKIHRIHIK